MDSDSSNFERIILNFFLNFSLDHRVRAARFRIFALRLILSAGRYSLIDSYATLFCRQLLAQLLKILVRMKIKE